MTALSLISQQVSTALIFLPSGFSFPSFFGSDLISPVNNFLFPFCSADAFTCYANALLALLLFHLLFFFVMNIFVAKLNYDTQTEDLREAFEEFGEVSSANIINDKFTGRSKGFGFVEMDNEEEALEAIRQLNDSDLDGRTIVVKKAEPRRERSGGNSYGNNRRNNW
jgi:hypothetical protein